MLNKLDLHEKNILKQAKHYGILDYDIHCYSEIFELEKLIEDWEDQLNLADSNNVYWCPSDYDPQGLDIQIEQAIENNQKTYADEVRANLRSYYNKFNLGV